MTTPLGKYKLVKLIAAGGMAEVYLARQAGAAGFEKQVCLKRILPHLARDKQFVDMFLNEARLASQLDHPNIVSIFDLGEANGNYFIAMEFIDGPNLRGVAKRAAELNEFLPIAEVLKIVAQAAAGLQYAHDLTDRDGNPLGLVHRDISPDNILVHRNGTAKVVDFGIAKAANSSGATRTGTLKGKVAYMPPEQLRGEALDRRTDVFALGVVLYELIGGRRPWEADNEVALIGQIMTMDATPLNELRPDAPEELVAIVHKAISKDRETRYQSCNELLADLEALLVTMGQSITQSRVADFVRAYSPPKAEGASTEGTNAELSSIEEQTFGTGMAPALAMPGTNGGAATADATLMKSDPGTMMMNKPNEEPKSRALLFGLISFAVVALIGGGVWFSTRGPSSEEAQPVEVERAPTVAQAKAPEAARPPELKPPEAKPPETKPPEAKPGEAKVDEAPKADAKGNEPRHSNSGQRVASAQPTQQPPNSAPAQIQQPAAPAQVMVIHEQAPAAPAIAAKGELVLQVRPWARVSVDGREVGVTPLPDALKLAAGTHTIRLTNPDLGKDITREVEIVAGEKNTVKEILDE